MEDNNILSFEEWEEFNKGLNKPLTPKDRMKQIAITGTLNTPNIIWIGDVKWEKIEKNGQEDS